MIVEIIAILLGLMVVILGYTTFNLLQKNERVEDIIFSYQEFIKNIQEQISKSEKRLEQIDQKGSFKSDDEIGWFFKEVKIIQKNLSRFKVDL
tara:strand:+ start:1141 stop:1419 length:279 start_codon:yes stop_codon:yes gene_type:complete